MLLTWRPKNIRIVRRITEALTCGSTLREREREREREIDCIHPGTCINK